MITELSTPSVVLIDDEEPDYKPILAALNELFISCVHIKGDDIDKLPETPFKTLRLVFLDLHLSGMVGKNAASYTANVFRRVVSSDAAPILVVIWSKFASDKLGQDDVSEGDRKTEADLFKQTLLERVPAYEGRLIFADMHKIKPDEHPEDWVEQLKAEIASRLNDQEAIDLLWKWDALVKQACGRVSAQLTDLAKAAAGGNQNNTRERLKDIMQRLAKAQGGGDFAPATAPHHLARVMGELLGDTLEQLEQPHTFGNHGNWLGQSPAGQVPAGLPGHMNSMLMTAGPNKTALMPGTVYLCSDPNVFQLKVGKSIDDLADICCQRKAPDPRHGTWRNRVMPILIEISPDCDVAQGGRTSAMLLAGLVVPMSIRVDANLKVESITKMPVKEAFFLKHPVAGFQEQEVFLMVSHRLKVSVPVHDNIGWLTPWFRLRDLPLASLRNAHAGQSARVGYVEVV